MKKSLIAGGLAGLLLACLPLNSIAQKRQYIQGNVHDVKYKETTEKDFPKYKLEEQNLFGNSYHFWNYTHKNGELDFWVSKREEEEMTFQEGKQAKIGAPSYIPTKISDRMNITELVIERTSLEKLKRRAKEKNSAGFSVDINDKDLKFELPQQTINGKKYLIFREMIDNSQERTDLPFYLIPKTKGTKIHFLEKSFLDKNNYEVRAVITCDEEGGIFQPILNENENLDIYDSGKGPSGIPEQNQGDNKKTDYMKYREELEKEKPKESKLEKQAQTPNTPTKKEEKQDSVVYHKIQKGDTFYTLADLYWGTGKEADEIERLNPGVDPKHLKIGQKIRVK